MLRGYKDPSNDYLGAVGTDCFYGIIPLIDIHIIYQFEQNIYIRMRNSDVYKIRFEKPENLRRVRLLLCFSYVL